MPQHKRRFDLQQLSRWRLFLCVGTVGLGFLGLIVWQKLPSLRASAQNVPVQNPETVVEVPVTRQLVVRVETHDLPQATVRVAAFPDNMAVSVAVADDVKPISAFLEHATSDIPVGNTVIGMINGGFFDPQNGKTTSHLVVDGEVVGDPADNARLVGNPALQKYLPQILNRSEFRTYRCAAQTSAGGALRYDIVFHNAAIPAGCAIESAVGAGPQLLPEDTSEREAFIDYEDGELIRDAIGGITANARSAIGIDLEGSIYFIMVEKTADLPGFTLAELSEFAASLGIVKLLNLDGGSSSSLHITGQTFHGRFDANGNAIERPVKSVLLAQ